MAVPAWFHAFPPTAASWFRSVNSGASYAPSPAASVSHGVNGAEVLRWRHTFTVPAGDTGVIRFTISGDIYDVPGPNSFGRMYLDGVLIAPNTGLSAGPFTSPPVAIGPGNHTFEWREGEYILAGNTVPVFSAEFFEDNPISDCCHDEPVCYVLNAACNVLPVQTMTPAAQLDYAAVTANPAGLIFGGNAVNGGDPRIGLIHSGAHPFTPAFTIEGMAVQPALTPITIEMIASSAINKVVGIRQWSGYGSDVGDGDGLGPCTKFTLLDENDAILVGPTLLNAGANNNPGFITSFPMVNGVRKIILQDICTLGPLVIGIREIELVQTFESTIVWDCPPNVVTAVVEDSNGIGSLTLSNNVMQQTGGPHTLTFSSPGFGFRGNINATSPQYFNKLVVTDEDPVLTVSGNGASGFTVVWQLEPRAPVRHGRLDINNNPPTLYDTSNLPVAAGTYEIVPCGG